MTTRQKFEEELEELQEAVFRLGILMEGQLENALRSLLNQDADMAAAVLQKDDELDQLTEDIENKCIHLVATQQPLATDLRMIFAANHMAIDLERMGDYSCKIAKVALVLQGEVYMKKLVDIPRMGEIALMMIDKTLNLYMKKDVTNLSDVAAADDELDALHHQILRELFTYIAEDQRNIKQAIHFMFISQHIERIGDHATNIMEWLHYYVTGERVTFN